MALGTGGGFDGWLIESCLWVVVVLHDEREEGSGRVKVPLYIPILIPILNFFFG